jgi:hypothetical protein
MEFEMTDQERDRQAFDSLMSDVFGFGTRSEETQKQITERVSEYEDVWNAALEYSRDTDPRVEELVEALRPLAEAMDWVSDGELEHGGIVVLSPGMTPMEMLRARRVFRSFQSPSAGGAG